MPDPTRYPYWRAVLDLNNCPVCGAARPTFEGITNKAGRDPSILATFACGAVFASYGGAPVESKILCPGPSRVAADYINRECDV